MFSLAMGLLFGHKIHLGKLLILTFV